MRAIQIDGKTLGEGNPCFIVVELSANHSGKFDLAAATIRAARRAGADAIKLQTYTPDTITLDCDNEYFRDILKGTLWEGRKLYDLYSESYTPWEWHGELFRIAREEGLVCFSSPFDKTAVDFLERLNTPAYKISSFEIQDTPLIEYAASKGKPVILSSGIATIEDIDLAVKTCREAGNDDIILLKCSSVYPSPLDDANLLTIPDMKKRFEVEVGFSDHTPGIAAPVVAVTLGAVMIEKHLIADKSVQSPDSAFSLDENEFASMVKMIRDAEKAAGKITYELAGKALDARKFGRSLFAVEDIKKGERFTERNVKSIRPASGLHPKYLMEILRTVAKKDYKRGEPLIP